MIADERQQMVDQLLRVWDAGQEQEAEAALLEVVRMLWGTDKPLLTTTEAMEALGMRSVNTLKVLLRAENVRTAKYGNRTMVPFEELTATGSPQQPLAECVRELASSPRARCAQPCRSALRSSCPTSRCSLVVRRIINSHLLPSVLPDVHSGLERTGLPGTNSRITHAVAIESRRVLADGMIEPFNLLRRSILDGETC